MSSSNASLLFSLSTNMFVLACGTLSPFLSLTLLTVLIKESSSGIGSGSYFYPDLKSQGLRPLPPFLLDVPDLLLSLLLDLDFLLLCFEETQDLFAEL